MRRFALCLFVGFSLSTAMVSAQSDGDDEMGARRQEALDLLQRSGAHYNEGRFAAAAELLEDAYRLHPEPTLLYNMARAYEGAGQNAEALDHYERYLNGAGEIDDRGAIERRITTLREQIVREAELRVRAASAHDAPEVSPASPPSNQSGGVEPAPWIITIVGAVGVGAGFVLGAVAQDSYDRANQQPEHRRAAELEQQANDLGMAANVTFVSAGVIALGGLLWGIVALATGDHDDDAVTFWPGGARARF